MTPEEIKAKMLERMKAAEAKAKGEEDSPPAEPEQTWTDAWNQMNKNSPQETHDIVRGLTLGLPQTLENTVDAGIGAIGMIPGISSLDLPGATEEKKDKARAIGKRLWNYTSTKGIKENMSQGLLGVFMDALGVVPLGPKGAGVVSKMGASQTTKAAGIVDKLLERNPGAAAKLGELGPGAVLADALPVGGPDAVRKATRHSDTAKATMREETYDKGRTLPEVRDPLLIDKLKASNDADRPAVHQAYEASSAAGGGIPTIRIHNPSGKGYKEIPADLEELFKANPEMMQIYEESAVKTATRKVTDGSIDNELARMQATQAALREEGLRSLKDNRQGTSGKSRKDMFDQAADYIDDVIEKHAANYPEAIELHRNLQKKNADIELQHKLDTNTMKETQRNIHKGATFEGPSKFGLAEVASAVLASGGGAGMAFGRPEAGMVAALASLGPLALKAIQRHGYKKAVKVSPEVAKALAAPRMPAKAKRSAFNKVKNFLDKGQAVGLPGMFALDREKQ